MKAHSILLTNINPKLKHAIKKVQALEEKGNQVATITMMIEDYITRNYPSFL